MQKINISLVFITQSSFLVSIDVRLNSTDYLITHSKRELKSIADSLSADIDYKDYVNIHRRYTSKPYYFLAFDTTSLRFTKKPFSIRYKNYANW